VSPDSGAAPAGSPSAREHPHDFASDNHSGAHPDVLEAIAAASTGHAPSYGDDAWTARAEELFREHFGPQARAFCVFNGTGANVCAIDAAVRGHESVICADVAHVNVDECGGPERIAGTKLLAVATHDGKIDPAEIDRVHSRRNDIHSPPPRLVSITQATELGTVYTVAETRAIADTAHELDMLLHVDGARLANAAVSLGVSFAELTTDAGVDLVSFGGTKNGLVLGEAVLLLRPGLADDFAFVRKQLGQLASKSRFIAAQFEALLSGDLWRRNASAANSAAARLAAALEPIGGVEVLHPVEANAVFAQLEPSALQRLLDELPGEHPFYVWDPDDGVARWMCSWDTTEADIEGFLAAVATAVGRPGAPPHRR
jgi:threonine aldolase